jgi:RNA polymerase sigma-70 factor, ECF subfamily
MIRLMPLPVDAGRTDTAAIERAWVVRARAGDGEAFRAIFDRYAGSVRRFLRDLLRDDAGADEATQETFVRAHQRIEALREGDKLASWLFGIARNVYFEHRRAASWLVSGVELDELEEDATVIDAVLPAPTPEAMLLDRELEGVLADALARVSESRRAALLLRIDHGLGYDEIAQVMGWSLQKVKNEIHRARLKLRVLLAPHVAGRH